MDTYYKGSTNDPAADLTATIDHVFAFDEHFDEAKVLAYGFLPLWSTDATKSSVDAYISINSITVNVSEESDPNLTGYVPLESLERL
jgi:hypothetical protein